MRELTREFVLAADEVWRLQGGKDHRIYRTNGGDDPECLSFQMLAARGHYGPGGGTKQGIYACTPTGKFLASINSTDPAAVAEMLRRGLHAWSELPEARRAAKSTLPHPIHRWEDSYPEQGLVLEQTFREFSPGSGSNAGFNRDYVWFSREEARSLLPETPEAGATYQVPRALYQRFARHHLLASAHGEKGGFAPHELEGGLEVEVLAVDDHRVRVRITGTSTANADPAKNNEGSHWRSKRVEAQLLGFADFDLERARFDTFELVAAGTATPRDSEEARPLGWFFALVANDRPSTRVSPTHADAYDAGWLHKPKLILHGLRAPKVITNSIGIELATIPAGSFSMGSAESKGDEDNDEAPAHRVQITRSFFMGVHEVTQAQYEQVMGVNPSYFAPGGKGEKLVLGLDTGSFPVERVMGTDAMEFCKKLSELPEEKAAGRIYRLPTEAEWEYTCRAGSTGDYSFGKFLSSMQANFNGELASPGAAKGPFLGRPTTVGSYRPNAFGLYDMSGNVSEWCLDHYRPDYYATSTERDPPGPTSGSGRVFRGGAWGNDAASCRPAYRDHSIDAYGYRTRGLRVVLEQWNDLPTEPPTAADDLDQVFQDRIRPFLRSYCFECHSGNRPKGDFRLDIFEHATDVATIGRKRWKQVQDKLLAGTMPPEEADQPGREEADFTRRWAQDTLATLRFSGRPDPGHETIRRLNRAEYENTIRDLLGVEFEATKAFPTDDVGASGASLSMAPLQMEKYVAASRLIAGQAAASLERPDPTVPCAEAVRSHMTALVSRAFRRPATEQEVERLIQPASHAIEQGGNFEVAIATALEAVLVSPHFLFKVELDSHPNDPRAVRSLDEFELATRMSYFIWSSMPDDELTEHARANTLAGNLDSQVLRMLADPRARALSEHFAGQWLQLGRLASVEPDRKLFPEFDDDLLEDMRTETQLFLAAIITEDRSLLDLVDTDFTFVNDRLARLYGMADVRGPGFRRVTLKGNRRGGLLTQASILTLTSNPNRTSPVKRGKWILESILGAPPAAPPPGVSELNEQATVSGSLREQLEQHRKVASCAACHAKMDALGFAFENFDPIGRWRTLDGAHPVDASGSLPDGREFDGARQLQALLRTDLAQDFLRCVTEKILSYALGRELEYFDEPAVRRILDELGQSGYRFSTLVREVVQSEPFRGRRGRRVGAL